MCFKSFYGFREKYEITYDSFETDESNLTPRNAVKEVLSRE